MPGLDNTQAWNRYAYVANNPLVLTDPSGHCWGFASGLRNTFLGTTCSNLDMAATIVASPDATIAQRAFAGGYIVTAAAAGTMLTAGGAILVAEAAPVAAGYAGTAVMQAQATAAAHPIAAGVVGGVLETAGECALTGGGCTMVDYALGAATAGIAHRASHPLDNSLVYRSVDETGTIQYVGITNNFERRRAEHLRSPRQLAIEPIPGLENLSRADALNAEQALVQSYGLENLLNIRNPISPRNPDYGNRLQKGFELLRGVGVLPD